MRNEVAKRGIYKGSVRRENQRKWCENMRIFVLFEGPGDFEATLLKGRLIS